MSFRGLLALRLYPVCDVLSTGLAAHCGIPRWLSFPESRQQVWPAGPTMTMSLQYQQSRSQQVVFVTGIANIVGCARRFGVTVYTARMVTE
ncbi:hypothetical protein J6590_073142 [Homalodisca vitripennis]|nr:hypothetical protein J6590_073142 [Homalodisca vitripennis]